MIRLFRYFLLFFILYANQAFAINGGEGLREPTSFEYRIIYLGVLPVSIAFALLLSRKYGSFGTVSFQRYLTYCILPPPIILASADLWLRYVQIEALRDNGSPLLFFWLVVSLALIFLHALFVKAVKGSPTKPQKIFAVWVLLVLGAFFFVTR